MTDDLVNRFYEKFQMERHKTGTVNVGRRLEFIREHVGENKDVVELGCRFGTILDLVRDKNRVFGCDIDRNAIKVCADKGIDVREMNLNSALDLSSASVDVVILTEVLEHLPYPSITLSEITRILRPGGKLVGSVPNGIHLRKRLSFLMGNTVDPDPTHLHHFSQKALHQLLSDWFEQVEIEPTGGRYIGISKNLFSQILLFEAVSPLSHDAG